MHLQIKMRQVLIVVDYENEWIEKNSEYYVGDISDKIKKLNKLITSCRSEKIQIIFTTHIEKESKKEFEKGRRTEIIKDIDFDRKKDILIEKYKISPFYKTKLESILKKQKADHLIITGILTNLCVRSIVSDAYDRNYKITVITDTCVAFSKKIHDFTINDLKETREEIEFLTAEQFIKK
jgi:nicotinamidase/pyrazinamidase